MKVSSTFLEHPQIHQVQFRTAKMQVLLEMDQGFDLQAAVEGVSNQDDYLRDHKYLADFEILEIADSR